MIVRLCRLQLVTVHMHNGVHLNPFHIFHEVGWPICDFLALIYVSYRAILQVSLPGWEMWQWECGTIIGMAYECVGQSLRSCQCTLLVCVALKI